MKTINLLFFIFGFFCTIYSQDTIVDYIYDKDNNISVKIETINDFEIRTEYFPNGKTKSYCSFLKKEIHGTYVSYYENGNTMFLISFKEGQKQGIAKFFYLNGNLQAQEFFNNNLKIGHQLYFDRQGVLNSIETYDMHGNIIKHELFNQ